MKLNFELDISGDCFLLQHIAKVVNQILRFNLLDITSSKFRKLSKCINIALVSLDRYYADSDSLGLSVLADHLIELFDLLELLLTLGLVEGTKPHIREAVSAHDHSGSGTTLSRQGNRGEHGRSQGC